MKSSSSATLMSSKGPPARERTSTVPTVRVQIALTCTCRLRPPIPLNSSKKLAALVWFPPLSTGSAGRWSTAGERARASRAGEVYGPGASCFVAAVLLLQLAAGAP